jgi:hypothetical protein
MLGDTSLSATADHFDEIPQASTTLSICRTTRAHRHHMRSASSAQLAPLRAPNCPSILLAKRQQLLGILPEREPL